MSTTYEIKVTVDANTKPPTVAVGPDPDVKPGKAKLTWTPAGGSDRFTFVGLAFKRPNPISNVVVAPEMITADDTNTKEEIHPYTVLVKVGNTIYPSLHTTMGSGDPTIRNK